MSVFSKHPSHLLKEGDESLAEERPWQQQAKESWEIHKITRIYWTNPGSSYHMKYP